MISTADPIKTVFQLFEDRGHQSYGESVTVLDHSLQSAEFARRSGESDTIVVAALLHDAGHLVCNKAEDIASQGIDTVHEEAGANFLARWFKPEVVEPGRLHVAAKRYLCATDLEYANELSPASSESLALQGGPFTDSQCTEFEANPYWREALVLRRYDDMGKVPGMTVKPLRSYESLLRSFLL